ncbi:MAG: aminopeptidase P family protein [Lachnospiraceae bacterium]|nr:aminopeptidase P family protein [Lachnospiraceae bacterium]
MSIYAKRVALLRDRMKERGIGAYLITSSDDHASEYPASYYEARKWISGFTGSAGILVVGVEEAGLYTDGRYYIQAEKELDGSSIDLMKQQDPETMDLLSYIQKVSKGLAIAGDFTTISAKDGLDLEGLHQKLVGVDLVNELWEDRPALPKEPAFCYPLAYTGVSAKEKITRLQEKLKEVHGEVQILTTLDDIAYLCNIRGNDIAYNPMVLSYMMITGKSATLYVDGEKLSQELEAYLKTEGITWKEYNSFYQDVKELKNQSVMVDENRINYEIYSLLTKNSCVLLDYTNPTYLWKAIKNEVEIKNTRIAHKKDGLAVTKFIHWLKKEIRTNSSLTEVSVANVLEELRKAQGQYIEPSFTTISAYGENAALMHYNPYQRSEEVFLRPEHMLLVDSGGQYLEGTTDITRTIALGPCSEEEIHHYTVTLKGFLALMNARFLRGVGGRNLDILARGPLWSECMDYRCGTGHGVGHLLGVHEGPNAFRYKETPLHGEDVPIVPGMITTDEPGVYVEGAYGIRIENELLCVSLSKNEYGEFLGFEPLTWAPIEMDLVDHSLLSAQEEKWLKDYMEQVLEHLKDGLTLDEQNWLASLNC